MDLQPNRRLEMNRPRGLAVERLNGGEPIIAPTEYWWETGVTFNAAALYVEPENTPVIRALLPEGAPADLLTEGVVAIHYRARPEVDPGSAFVRSFIGLAVFTPDLRPIYRWPEPVVLPDPDPNGFDTLGVEDPRITRLGDTFYMIYCGLAADPVTTYQARLCMATSIDLVHWKKLGVIPSNTMNNDNKDGVLFPEPVNGKYYLLHRPYAPTIPRDVRLAAADAPEGPYTDLGLMMRPYPNPRMKTSWLGAGSVPIAIGGGRYIAIYHTGNAFNDTDREYDLAAALIDFKAGDPAVDPEKLVTNRLEPMMVPETPAELRSHSQLQVGNVLFACGSYEYKGDVYIIYGGADTYTLGAKVRKADLVRAVETAGLGNPYM